MTAPGIAPDSDLYYSAASDLKGAIGDQLDAIGALLAVPVHVINFSWFEFYSTNSSGDPIPTSTPGTIGRYLDEQGHDLGSVFVAGSGNSGEKSDSALWRVASPANGLNVIAVGGMDVKTTDDWSDDEYWAGSNWQDPTGIVNDRAKPDVLAPSTTRSLSSTSSPPYRIFAGTSAAAPHASGTVALMKEAAGGVLYTEEARAALMVGAIRDMDGTTASLGEYDGAGAINTVTSVDTIIGGRSGIFRYRPPGLTLQCYPKNTTTIMKRNLQFNGGNLLRVALVYASAPPQLGADPYVPTADLDLIVGKWDPATDQITQVVASSSRWESNTEFVEFAVPSTGLYAIGFITRSCSRPPNYVGYAWLGG